MRLFPVPPPEIGHKWSVDGNRRRWHALNEGDVRRTPRTFFDELDAEFHFTVDVAALPENALCPRYFTALENDGLKQSWQAERCWMNPPYSQIDPWVEKAAKESAEGGALVIGLLPVRTDLGWFHDGILAVGAEVRFIRGRLRFGHGEAPPTGNAPFPSMVVVWR